MFKFLIGLSTILILVSCGDDNTNTKKFEVLKTSKTGIHFQNTIEPSAVNVFEYVNMYNGAGVGVGDFNNDNFEDLFFAGNLVSSKLYLNNGKVEPFTFLDTTEESGVTTDCWVNGVTIVDIDQNGLDDIYLSVSAGKSGTDRANKLFINKGTDANGTVRFEERAEQFHLNDTTHTIQSAFFDYDGDKDLDVFMIVNHPTGYLGQEANRITRIQKIGNPERTDRLYRNDGLGNDGHPVFTDVSQKAGITLEGFSLGLAINDFNEDGKPDIYVANDYVTNDIIYINNGDGTFTDRIRDYVNHTSFASMGIDVADINNDGKQDFMVLDMLPENDNQVKRMYPATNHFGFDMREKLGYVDQYNRNSLQLNNGLKDSIPRKFSEIGRFSKIFNTNWSWSTLMPDLDLDGWRDIFVTNGFLKDVNDLDFVNYDDTDPFGNQKKRDDTSYLESLKTQEGLHIANYLFRNNGDLSFEDKSEDWGFTHPSYSNGAVYADFDNDGDLDLAINNINEPASIYKNHTNSMVDRQGNYLQIVLKGERPNEQAIGARIDFETSQGAISHINYTTRGFMSSVSSIANFGLGQDTLISHINIIWPDGKQHSISNVNANQRITITKETKSDNHAPAPLLIPRVPLLEPHTIEGLNYLHTEMPFNDFDYQVLIPNKLSRFGPSIASGDINNNQREDIYIGGAKGSSGKIYFQDKNGAFTSFQLEESVQYEDQASLLLDIDNDNDLDLYIASGGVENGRKSRYYSDRLWINLGNQKWKKAAFEFPQENSSCVVAADYDKDGDLDIFVGGASIPEAYPLPAKSMLLQNNTLEPDKPSFVNLADTAMPELRALGVVRSALWSDYDNDGWEDLFVVGDFMSITIFKNEKGKLVKIDAGALPSEKGMWNSINGHDVDLDGDIDYILGNYGLNSRYRPTKEEPIKIYVDDFDQNGIIDPIMTYFSNEREVPVHLRDDLVKQLVSLKKTLPTYKKYAEASIADVIPKEILNKARTFEWNYANSAYLLNNGQEGFKLVSFPDEVQIAPIYGTLITDLNGDDIPDILAVGNSHGQEVFSGWQDASFGTLLFGNDDGTFESADFDTSGFYVDGDTRAIVNIAHGDNSYATLVSLNNDSLKIFSTSAEGIIKKINLEPSDKKAEITYENGKTELREFYYGSGYYSQSTRSFPVTEKMKSIKIYSSNGHSRDVSIPSY